MLMHVESSPLFGRDGKWKITSLISFCHSHGKRFLISQLLCEAIRMENILVYSSIVNYFNSSPSWVKFSGKFNGRDTEADDEP